jgi:VIT1/CCC1 family predicted Fe2+/Mn2+ transporter
MAGGFAGKGSCAATIGTSRGGPAGRFGIAAMLGSCAASCASACAERRGAPTDAGLSVSTRFAVPQRKNAVSRYHGETHRSGRVGWLRAAVLGANDGIVSTASLILGFAASGADRASIVLAGVAGLVAGALSMATGEYVSVSSQADTENADLALERRELAQYPEGELSELTGIYVKRGLEPALAARVAEQLTAHDALAAHARDELGITHELRARPLQAAAASALAFATGAALPLAITMLAPASRLIVAVTIASLVFLALLGAAAARTGGAAPLRGALRVTLWSALAMGATALIGKIVGA